MEIYFPYQGLKHPTWWSGKENLPELDGVSSSQPARGTWSGVSCGSFQSLRNGSCYGYSLNTVEKSKSGIRPSHCPYPEQKSEISLASGCSDLERWTHKRTVLKLMHIKRDGGEFVPLSCMNKDPLLIFLTGDLRITWCLCSLAKDMILVKRLALVTSTMLCTNFQTSDFFKHLPC